MNLQLMLEKTALQYPRKTAIVMGEHRLSYTELNESANRLANALLKMGVRKGDRVAVLLTNRPEYAIAYFGITEIGAIAVPLDTRYKIDEFAAVFASCQPKVLLAESPYLETLAPALSRFRSIEHVIDLNATNESQFLSYREIMATSPAQKVATDLDPDDIAVITYTSGPSTNPHGD